MTRATQALLTCTVGLAAACSSSSSPTQPPNQGATPCPSGSSATTVTLAVGQVSALTVPGALDCVTLATEGGGAGTFLVVAANADQTPDAVGHYQLALGAADADNDVATAARVRRLEAAPASTRDTRSIAEGRFRAMERRVLHLDQPHLVHAAAAALRATPHAVSRALAPNVGDTLTFNVPSATASNACTTFTTQKAVVKAVGTHGIIVQDVKAPSGGFTNSDFQSIATEFDNIIYPTDTTHFGGPSDIDGNGHVFLLFTPQVNAATKKGSNSILEGFFFEGDLFPSTGSNSCSESNEGEIFYLLVPDPSGTFSDARSTSDVRQDIRGTIGHEFQHMINAGVRIFVEDAPDESTWLNEGLSHFAEELVGRAEDNYTDTQELTIDDIADFPALNNYRAFFGQNLERLRAWMLTPGTLGATSNHADTSLAVRGAAWSLLRWSADHYAAGNVAAFTRALVAGPQTGVANLVARAGVPFDSITAGWLPALYLDGSSVAVPARYSFSSWNIRNAELGLADNNGVFPLGAPALSTSGTTTDSVGAAAANYYTVSVPASGSTVLGELDPAGGPVTFAGARLYIVRVQ